MFRSARLKLTFWYLGIIMAISLSFSAFIYRGVTQEFRRRLNVIERRFSVETPRGWRMHGPVHDFFIEDVKQARTKVLFILLYANGVILALSSAAGYFLAGWTLAPIEKAMEEQRRFVADASHELRTPLAALKTSIEVALREKPLKSKQAGKVLKESLEDIDHLTDLTNKLLLLSRLNKGNQLSFSKVHIEAVIREAVGKIEPLAKKKGIGLNTDLAECLIEADAERIREMVLIFLDNAIKYTPRKGKIKVSLKKDKQATLKISDTGVGISKKHLPHIFARFYRVDSARAKTKADGFGLGLALAKQIIEAHKDRVQVKSQVDKGTTFTIKLPIKHS